MKKLPKPYYQNDLGVLYCGDCLKILPLLEPVDTVLTDPPYGLNKKIHDGGTWATAKKYNAVLDWDFKPSKSYFNSILKSAKNAIIFGGNYFSNYLPTSRCWLVWIKPHFPTMSEVDLIWTNLDRPSKPFFYNRVNPSIHPTQKPVELIKEIILKYSLKNILDPFLGSGTTAVACEKLNRKWIGIEISEEYCEISVRRIKRAEKRRKSSLSNKLYSKPKPKKRTSIQFRKTTIRRRKR